MRNIIEIITHMSYNYAKHMRMGYKEMNMEKKWIKWRRIFAITLLAILVISECSYKTVNAGVNWGDETPVRIEAESLQKNQYLSNILKITNVQLYASENLMQFYADVENISDATWKGQTIRIKLYDKDGNEIFDIAGIIGNLKSGEKKTKWIDSSSTGGGYENMKNAVSYKIVAKNGDESTYQLNNASIEYAQFIKNMPKLSEEDAKQFLAFVYNDAGYEELDLTNDDVYKMLTGNIDDSKELSQVRADIWSFSTMVRANLNYNISDSAQNVDYLSDELVVYLKKEMNGMQNVDAEVVDEVGSILLGYVREGMTDLFANTLAKHTDIILTEENFEEAELLVNNYKDTEALRGKIDQYVSRVVAAVQAAFLPLENEKVGRYSYFASYLDNRKNYISSDDEIFQTIMDYNFLAAKENSYISSAIDMTTWITGKDSWSNHRDDIERWAEYLYSIEQYMNTEVHSYQKTTVEPTCVDKGYTEYICEYCGKSYKEDEIPALGHNYNKWIVEKEATCMEEGMKRCDCLRCGEQKIESIASLGHDYSNEWITDILPTYDTAGSKSRHCIRCDAKTDIMSIPSIGKKDIPLMENTGEIKVTVMTTSKTEIPIKISIEKGNLSIASFVGTTVQGNSCVRDFKDLQTGYYNVVVRTTDGNYVESHMAEVQKGQKTEVKKFKIPVLKSNSKVTSEVKIDENSPETPLIAVEGLSEVVTEAEENQSIEIQLHVSKQEIEDESIHNSEIAKQQSAILDLMKKNSQNVEVFLDFNLMKTVEEKLGQKQTNKITDTNGVVLQIAVPYQSDKKDFVVYRYHDGKVDAFEKLEVRAEETDLKDGQFYVGDEYILIYTSKFSTYAIGYGDGKNAIKNENSNVKEGEQTEKGTLEQGVKKSPKTGEN